jgi:hypothetical protein
MIKSLGFSSQRKFVMTSRLSKLLLRSSRSQGRAILVVCLAGIISALGSLPCLGDSITSVSQISGQKSQTITISGTGFGTMSPYTGDSGSILVYDATVPWSGGFSGTFPGGYAVCGASPCSFTDTVTLVVDSWTNTKIVLGGFAGAYGSPYVLTPGDSVSLFVLNGDASASITTTVATTPEPSSVYFMLAAVIVLFLMRKPLAQLFQQAS